VVAHLEDFDGKPVEPAPSAADLDELVPYGLGWRWQWRVDRTCVRMTFRNLRKTTTGLTAEVAVDAWVPVKGIRGTLTVERLGLADGRARVALANRLEKRTGEGPEAPIRWQSLLDGICSRILVAQRAGPKPAVVGLDDETGINWLIEGLVEDHQTTSIYGDGEVGKSWQLIAAMVSLASGEEIIPGWRPTRRGRGLLLDWETDQETINRRVRMICRGAGIPYVPIDYVACDGPLVDQMEWLLERVQEDDIDLIGVDSVEAAMQGSRSDGADLNDAAGKVNQVLRKLGRSAILVDHVNAIGAASSGLAGKAYGSIFKRNWVRMSYELKRVHEGSDDEKHLGVYCTKRNNGSRFDAFGLRWTINDEMAAWEREEITEPELQKALSVKRRMEIALGEQTPLSMSSLAEICEAKLSQVRVEVSRDKGKTFRKTANDLIELAPRLNVVRAGADEPEELPWP
jgi:hypothetical protein